MNGRGILLATPVALFLWALLFYIGGWLFVLAWTLMCLLLSGLWMLAWLGRCWWLELRLRRRKRRYGGLIRPVTPTRRRLP